MKHLYKLNVFCFLTVILFISSCSKTDTIDSNTIDNELTPKGPLLKSYIEIGSNNDTSRIIHYVYDSEKRIKNKKLENKIFHLQQGIFQYAVDSAVYLYNGLSKMPYQIINYYSDWTFSNLRYMHTRNSYFVYDSIGRLINDSSYLQNTYSGEYEKLVSEYKYVGDTIFTENKFNYYNATYINQKIKTNLVFCNNNNVCTQYDSLYIINNGIREFKSNRSLKYTYSGEDNPLFYTKMKYPTWNSPQFDHIYSLHNEVGYIKNYLKELEFSSSSSQFGYGYYKQYNNYINGSNGSAQKITSYTLKYNGDFITGSTVFLDYY